ncbi:hypothetical protein J1N35_041530 [Gossypium stocksii]|uniref:Uncharacterized protein n=1 Tax=Gossypium stocksii TaxID=47602 RepID=A0A9D3UFZ6_9ROSI|nr:hypothetical protein J1N35_041530 [Gossypium stocksii]
MNTQQKLSTPVKDHMITLMGYVIEVMDNEANLDKNTQIEMVFESLFKVFASFQATFNVGNKNLTLYNS